MVFIYIYMGSKPPTSCGCPRYFKLPKGAGSAAERPPGGWSDLSVCPDSPCWSCASGHHPKNEICASSHMETWNSWCFPDRIYRNPWKIGVSVQHCPTNSTVPLFNSGHFPPPTRPGTPSPVPDAGTRGSRWRRCRPCPTVRRSSVTPRRTGLGGAGAPFLDGKSMV